ncbi:hypothetical protein [Pseudoduganella namucuonensis]|uniref:Uncharacterized protein n=1 Tax=Pseudoduganella namucuonensis TaxID=1035707 RepID=A0A1I7M4U3_9BURK|nr:hypothetical protein [Pseudoduganella namucuonensis]SFV16961.1 hypothetical protein SAMN05216552_105711 [Pseudoduganella namucuonensis]
MRKRPSLLPGLLVSLLLHGGLLYLAASYRHAPEQPVAEAQRMLVRLVPKAEPAAAPQASGEETVTARAPRRAARLPPAPASAGVIAALPRPAEAPLESEADAAAVAAKSVPAAPARTQDPADPFAEHKTPAPEPGQFDANTALKSARKLATAKATRDDPAVAQIYDKPINPIRSGSELGRNVAGAARADCKNVAAGTGVLAIVIVPLILLTDKKDSGCKW